MVHWTNNLSTAIRPSSSAGFMITNSACLPALVKTWHRGADNQERIFQRRLTSGTWSRQNRTKFSGWKQTMTLLRKERGTALQIHLTNLKNLYMYRRLHALQSIQTRRRRWRNSATWWQLLSLAPRRSLSSVNFVLILNDVIDTDVGKSLEITGAHGFITTTCRGRLK